MSADFLSASCAARRLGITVSTLYSWLGLSDHGLLVIRGRAVSIDYYQGGPRGQGRICIEEHEVARVRELMRVHPQKRRQHHPRLNQHNIYPGIVVALGRPAS